MARFKQSVMINQPAERVFAFVSDFENDPPWSGVTQVRRTSQGPLGVGTTFQVRQRFLGRHLDVELEVVRYEPSRVITVKTTSSRFLSMTGTRLVEPAGETTQVTFLGTGHTRGLLKPLEPLLAAAAGGHRLQTQLARLRQCLETQTLRTRREYHRPVRRNAPPATQSDPAKSFHGSAAPARRQMSALNGATVQAAIYLNNRRRIAGSRARAGSEIVILRCAREPATGVASLSHRGGTAWQILTAGERCWILTRTLR